MVDRVNAAGGSYHQLELGPDLVIKGDYDMRKYLSYYKIADRLDGTTVLDVGTSSGFFALEAYRRGATVTAIDIWADDCLLAEISQTMGLDLTYFSKNIYDLDPSFGTFDLVICGSLLLHLPDPVGALRALRAVTGERLVISTAATPDSAESAEPVCHFVGRHADDGDYWAYWTVGAVALRQMLLAAGFSRVEDIDHFTLKTEDDRVDYSVPHVVMSAYV